MITVITLTRNRCISLQKAILSVKEQDIKEKVDHLIIIDDCLQSRKLLEDAYSNDPDIKWIYYPREEAIGFCAPHVAALRNKAVSYVESPWIAFLDDDNEWETTHLSSLHALAVSENMDAVYSNMQLFWNNGKAFDGGFVPWVQIKENAEAEYKRFLELNIFHRDSNIVKNIFKPALRTVDMGEWLFKTEVIKRIHFREEYTKEDELNMITEDDKLNDDLYYMTTRVASTNLPTLRYYLGGYSNKRV